MQQISPLELAAWLADSARPQPRLVDVREASEFEICAIAGAQLMPMREVPARVGELDAAAEIVLICHHGQRSQRVAMFLERQGFGALFNLAGGVAAWARDVDPAMPTY